MLDIHITAFEYDLPADLLEPVKAWFFAIKTGRIASEKYPTLTPNLSKSK